MARSSWAISPCIFSFDVPLRRRRRDEKRQVQGSEQMFESQGLSNFYLRRFMRWPIIAA